MTPHDIAADLELLVRFQSEVGYLDRLPPDEREMGDDTDRLLSPKGAAAIAWLWPSPGYEPGFDPFDAVSIEEGAATRSTTSAFYHQRQSMAARQRRLVAGRFRQIIELVAGVCGRSLDDVKAHIEWSVPLAGPTLERLLDGRDAFPLSTIVRVCEALQLAFESGWLVVDPERLGRRIDQSVVAARISAHLRHLTFENLESMRRRLPRGSADAGQAMEPDLYLAPPAGSRYRPLYDTLAADGHSAPTYSLDEIDRVLVFAGKPALPQSARKDRSWWAGTGARTEGRPQLSAWWAAGYRIQGIEADPQSGEIAAIEYAELPGRREWLADPDRTAKLGYQRSGPASVKIHPTGRTEGTLDVLGLRGWAEISGGPELPHPTVSVDLPEDHDIRKLLDFLKAHAEADRSAIESYFRESRGDPVDPSWMTNLLTRARRHGWIVNLGTKSRPRWAVEGMRGWAEL